MDRKYTALIYSNFSRHCEKLTDYLGSLRIDIPKLVGISIVNVDCEEIRNKILNETTIRNVPTLIMEYYNGEVFLFEGYDQIKTFVDSICEKILGNENATDAGVNDAYHRQQQSQQHQLPQTNNDVAMNTIAPSSVQQNVKPSTTSSNTKNLMDIAKQLMNEREISLPTKQRNKLI